MESPAKPARSKRKFSASFNMAVRWLHIYISMLGFLTLIFFSFTGITLNHPTWFGGETAVTRNVTGKLPLEWLTLSGSEPSLNQLQIAEELREKNRLRGRVADFRESEDDCSLTFKGPGYSADALIDRKTGDYELTIVEFGLVGRWNDLHKGRDSGLAWSWLIDISAVVMIISAVTGLVMLLFIKRKRNSGLVTTLVGAVLFMIFYWWLVP